MSIEVERNYASRGLAGTALGLGIAGTAGVGVGLLGSLMGANRSSGGAQLAASMIPAVAAMAVGSGGTCSENTSVNRYELDQAKELANKDMEIAYWRGQDETNRKITETYAVLEGRINALAGEVRANKDEQNGINLQQAVYNGTNTAALGCLQSQVAQLYSLTKLVVPNGSVCPGWGDVTVTATTTTTS